MFSLSFQGCADPTSNSGLNSLTNGAYLYIASGACYAGGATVSTGNATIAKYSLSTGEFVSLVLDYNNRGNNDQPASISRFGSDQFIVAVENTAGRRLDIVHRNGTGLMTYITHATALNQALRYVNVLADGSVLVSKTSAIEKFSAARNRVTQGASPFVSNPQGACATSSTQMTSNHVLPGGLIVYTHAAASPNNQIGVISATGYAAPADCLAAQTAPDAAALPTSALYHPQGRKLLVAYGSATASANYIYSYDINLSTGAISNPVEAFADYNVVRGPTHMKIDPDTGAIYVANGASVLNNIEKFTLDSDGTLNKSGSVPFIASSIHTRCISSLEIAP
jgi:hypothetical protein